MLEITNESIKDVLVIHLDGRLDGITSKSFMEKVSEYEQAKYARVVLNCEHLTYISSEGLRVILVLAKNTRSLGGVLALCDLTEAVKFVITISGFDNILGVYDSVEKAIKAVS